MRHRCMRALRCLMPVLLPRFQRVEYSNVSCVRFAIFLVALIFGCSLPAPAAAAPPGTGTDLKAEYSKAMGFAAGQVLDASISDNGIMKVSIDECSFCGAFKNDESRNRIARSTLAWFLSKTGAVTGTVEWYNKARVNIMTISGSREHSEITAGLPCAINKP